nr:PIN domain-containing protein [Pseudomonas sp. UBA6718]
MIDLIIDTSILRTDPHRQKSGFKAISELSKREKINVHIPKIVEQEFLTQEEEYLETAFSEAKKSILNLRKRLGEKHTQHLSKIENLLDDLQIASKNNCKEQFNEWIKNHEIIIGEIHPEHNSRVLDAYFLGAPPFKAKKSRNDIPDAFIFEYIKDLAINRDKAHVIAGDGALRETLKKTS